METITLSKRRWIVGMIITAIAALFLMVACDGPSSPGGGWKKVASPDDNNRPKPGAPIYFQCPFC